MVPAAPIGLLLAPGALSDGGSPVDLSGLGQYGVLGIFAGLLVWFARGAHQRERDRADRDRADRDRMEQENRALHMMILEKVIPVLAEATQAAEQSARMLNEIRRERDRDRKHGDRGGNGAVTAANS